MPGKVPQTLLTFRRKEPHPSGPTTRLPASKANGARKASIQATRIQSPDKELLLAGLAQFRVEHRKESLLE